MDLAGGKVAITVAVLLAVGQMLGTGLKQYEKGEYEPAVAQFTAIINGYAVNAYTDDAYYWRAASYLKLNRKEEAKRDLMTVMQKFPNSEYAARAELDVFKMFSDDPTMQGGLKKRIDDLIGQLGDKEFAVREEATKRLVEIGELALTALGKAVVSEDPEVKMRAEKIVADIQERALLAKLDPPESYVTLKGDNVLLSKLFKAIEEQTGNPFDLRPNYSNFQDRPVTVDWQKVTFWQALDDLCQKGQMYVQGGDNNSVGLRLYSGRSGAENWPTTYAGPLRMSVTGLNKYYNFQDNQAYLNLNGQFWVEPRLRCTGYYYPQATRATDDGGQELAVQAQGSGMNSMYDGMTGNWNMSLRNVSREARQISRVEGSVVLLIPVKFDELVVKDVEGLVKKANDGKPEDAAKDTQPVPVQKGPYSLTVTNVSRQNNQLAVQMTINQTFGPGEQMTHQYYRPRDFTLVDAQGSESRPTNVNHERSDGNNNRATWGGTAFFPIPAEGKTVDLHFQFASRVIKKDVPFHLENIPLP